MDTSDGGLPPRQAPTAGKPTGAKKKTQVSPVRNLVGVILLLVLVPVGVIEFKAGYDYNRAVDRLNAAVGNESGDLLGQDAVEKMIGKTPDGPLVRDDGGVGNTQKATYTWRGIFKTRSFDAYYTLSKPPGLVRVGEETTK